MHFPPLNGHSAKVKVTIPGEKPAEPAEDSQGAVLDAYFGVLRDIGIIAELFKALGKSSTRHGDLQACKSAAIRIKERLQALIEAEETK